VGQVCKGYAFSEVQISIYRDGTPRTGRKPKPDPATEKLIVKAFEMKAQGAPHEAISKETGLYPSKSGSWEHFFHSRAYIGEYEFMGEVFTNIYPPLISKELFDVVQERMPKRQTRRLAGRHHPRRKGSTFFLADIAVCAYCGSPMEGKSVGAYRYYICRQHNENAALCPEAALVPANDIEEATLNTLCKHMLDSRYLQDLLEWTNERLNSGLEELTLLINKTKGELEEAERIALKYARNFGTMDKPTPSAERILHEQEALIARLQLEYAEHLQQHENSRVEATPEQIERYIGQARAMMEGGEFFDLRELCGQLCNRLILGKDECQLELHFPEME
jgi:hypothetical protein